jgi:hypothetical protein
VDIGTYVAEPPRVRLLTWTRVLFAVTVIGGLIAGYIGTAEYIATGKHSDLGTGFWNIVYYDLQLFVLGSQPLQDEGPFPLALDVARFAAPAATIYALFEAGRALFAGEIRRYRARRRRDHTIVTGDTTTAYAFVATLRGHGEPVAHIFRGDAAALVAAGVMRAKIVYACGDDREDATLNVATAQAAATAVTDGDSSSERLKIYAQVSDATLALALRARWLGNADKGAPDVDFFNVDELAARAALEPGDFDIDPRARPHILIAGLGTFGQSILVEYARRWRLSSSRAGERVAVTLVDHQASVIRDELLARWGVVRDVCEITAYDAPTDAPTDADFADALWEPATQTLLIPHRAYVCFEDEELTLRTALTAASLWRGRENSVVVRLNRLARHDAISGNRFTLLDTVDGRLRLVSVTALGCQPAQVHEDLVLRLAQAIHRHYLLERRRGPAPTDVGSLVEWEQLPSPQQEANRAQARDIGAKLRHIGATVSPLISAPDSDETRFTFTHAEIEELAEMEHARWCAERRARHLEYGPVRDDKHHPDLVPWDELSEKSRDKDREAVRNLIPVLADAGLRIVRLVPAGESRQRPDPGHDQT